MPVMITPSWVRLNSIQFDLAIWAFLSAWKIKQPKRSIIYWLQHPFMAEVCPFQFTKA